MHLLFAWLTIFSPMQAWDVPLAAFAWDGEKETRLFLGGATETTPFALASITKVFTATELALQVLKGNIQLQEIAAENKTFFQLATHTSGLPREKGGALQPGYLYSNYGFDVLGEAIGRKVGLPFETLISEDILQPLQMEATTFQRPRLGGSGGLFSTLKDMQHFLKANLALEGPPFLQQAMRKARIPLLIVRPPFKMGLGWQIYEEIVDKNGAIQGYSSYIGMIPEYRIGLIILARKNKLPLTRIGREILRRMKDAKISHAQRG